MPSGAGEYGIILSPITTLKSSNLTNALELTRPMASAVRVG